MYWFLYYYLCIIFFYIKQSGLMYTLHLHTYKTYTNFNTTILEFSNNICYIKYIRGTTSASFMDIFYVLLSLFPQFCTVTFFFFFSYFMLLSIVVSFSVCFLDILSFVPSLSFKKVVVINLYLPNVRGQFSTSQRLT